MLNRLYVIIGLLAIIALSAAFVVPRFVQWGDYRARMEAIASEALGAKVEIVGDIGFSLLPQPELHFSNVVVGPSEDPLLMVDQVVADFSLLDFLRDRYVVTKLVLTKPVLDLKIDESGLFDSRLQLADEVKGSNISVANARIEQGAVRVTDARSGQTYLAGALQGDLSMEALQGPFVFQGSAAYAQTRYSVRISTGAMDEAGAAQVALSVRPESEAFVLSAEGFLTTGPSPRYLGQLTYRQAPPPATDAKAVQGDLLLTSKLDAGPDRILLSAYTLQPDENRAGARFTGAAVIHIGENTNFDAVVSGGVYALPPRDATQETGLVPFELVRLISELPAPPLPPMPGKLTIDMAELNLRAFSLRDFKVEAVSDGTDWQLNSLTGQLPGATAVTAEGQLGTKDGQPQFSGRFSVSSERLDALAALWRKPPEGNPLFNMPGSLSGGLVLADRVLSVEGGAFVLNGVEHMLSTTVGIGDVPRLDVEARLSSLDQFTSPALAALLPEASDAARFGLSFPDGSLNASADAVEIAGMPAKGLSLIASWSGAGIEIERLVADDIGGVGFDGALTASGTLAAPRLSGDGGLMVASADAPAVQWFYDQLGAPARLREYLAASLPAELTLNLGPPAEDGAQSLAAIGRLGAATLALDAKLGQGIATALAGPLSATVSLTSDDPTALTAQLGLGAVSLVPPGGAMAVNVTADGVAGGSFDTVISITGGTDLLSFEGTVTPGDLSAPSGSGTIKYALSDVSTLAQALGLDGIYVPSIDGTARVSFVGGKSLGLAEVNGTSAGAPFSGDFQIGFDAEKSVASGLLTLGRVDVAGLAAFLAGPSALLRLEGGIWPDGPLAVGETPRKSAGRISVQAPEIASGTRTLATDTTFDLDWDETATRIRALQGTLGEGKLTLDASLCCAGPLADKQLTGRITLAGVALDALLPDATAAMLEGKMDAGIRIDATGASFAAIASALTGEGSFSVNQLQVEGFDPGVFAAIAGLDNIVELEPADFTVIVADNLTRGPFKAETIGGSLTIAGGVLRVANLAAEGENARLFGGLSSRLAELNLGGDFTLTPIGSVGEAGLINETTAGVTATLSGTLFRPQRTLGISSMVDAIKVRALEIELDRLEQLQAEDEARRKAAAEADATRIAAEEEAARQAAEEKRKADEAARIAAEQEAKRLALEAEANRIAAEQQMLEQQGLPGPLDLQLPPAQ